MAHVRIFLSTVSAEFRSYRDALRHYLDRPNLTVKVQEDFIVTGTETLDMLDAYIRQCDVVIHLVGDMTGAMAHPSSVAVIRERYPDFGSRLPVGPFLESDGPPLSYTQWEAWLALYHARRLIIAIPAEGAVRDERYILDLIQQAGQKDHLLRLAGMERYPGIFFASAEQLAAEVWRSSLLDILVEAGLIKKPTNLPYRSLGDLFKGREDLLAKMDLRLGPVPQRSDLPAVVMALTGMGGVGKTRLALEYAWRHAGDYTALLLVGADSAEALNRNLAALCAAPTLDLPEKDEKDEGRQRDAALGWMRQHPGWLLILDNIDTEPAATAAEALAQQLTGGHLLFTSRLTNWSGTVEAVPVDELSPEAATEFLLLRTAAKRRPQTDDSAMAGSLAKELGYLALALEQACAYIAHKRLGFSQYLIAWQRQRDTVLEWFDPRLMQYPRSVAITWQTSFDQLGETARRLLQRLSWLAPDPIPESLLDVPIPGQDSAQTDPYGDLAELESYSLVTRAADRPYFSVHRLVQEVARRGQSDDPVHGPLVETLNWVNNAFVGDPVDIRDWPVLDPLASHVRMVAAYADEFGIAEPGNRLSNEVGLLLFQKAMYNEAEPLMRRALSLAESSYGADHPNIAVYLNNLAQLLKVTNRLDEAEPLMRRVLSIDESSFGMNHPIVARHLNNLAGLLHETNRLDEAEPLMRRALSIAESSFGIEHPDVARNLNNLAMLLQDTNRLDEAETLMHRALSINELIYGAYDPNVATSLNNLARLLHETNRLDEAEPLIRRALSIDESNYGGDHPKVAVRLNNLGQLLKMTNRLAEAEPMLRRALSIDESSFGMDHPSVARDLNNLAGLLHETNRLEEAEPLMRRALSIDESSYNANHPVVAIDLSNLAELLQDTNRLDEAEPLLRRVLSIDESCFGADHSRVSVDLNNLAKLLYVTNRLAEAEPLMRRALVIFVKSFGLEHRSINSVAGNYITLLRAMGRTDDEIRLELASLMG